MQVVMAAVLLATIGLAALLARSRQQATAFAGKPHLTDTLAIRLPKKWRVFQDPEEPGQLPTKVVATEMAMASNPRTIVVYQTAVSSESSEEVLREYLSREPGDLGGAEPFDVLDHPGVIARFDSIVAIPEDPLGRAELIPGWYAAAVVPNAGPGNSNLGVVVGVYGETAAGPPGRGLVRQVADGLSVRAR